MLMGFYAEENQKRRRRCSMLKKVFGNFKYLLLVTLFLLAPSIRAWAGIPFFFPVANTDTATDQLYYFWDLRDGESFFQVTNTADFGVTVHIQVFDSSKDCAEFDFLDDFTPNDTHVYNVRSLDRNCAADGLGCTPLASPVLDGDFGFVVVSDGSDNDALIGNFRIIHNAGFEYRTNAAGLEDDSFENIFDPEYTFNFNDVNGTTFADVVGISAFAEPGTVFSGPGEFVDPAIFFVQLWDENENPLSCPEVSFSCATDLGINQKIVNADGAPSLCLGTDARGIGNLFADPGTLLETNPPNVFIGFLGLNNGDHTGTMDSFWAGPTPAGIVPVAPSK